MSSAPAQPQPTPQGPARAEVGAPPPNGPAQETIEIGLSTNRVRITSDFTGADLTIFGALDNADPLISRQGRYDVIVVLEGPSREVVVRRKSRVLGIWMNTRSESFVNVPISYSVATTRQLQDITTPASYRRLSLGVQNLHLQPSDTLNDPESIVEFTAALRERKLVTGLFSENFGGVEFLSQNLFRATLRLAPDVPVGTHRARAFLFRNGAFVKETSAQLAIMKSGFEQRVFRSAHDYSLLYGLFAVALAVATGWLGRIVFRRD
ncbi:MAG: TIGR02186 family protein [Rhizobiaceae bacterium]|nr:TIGR02186 family protein [Rhizobiaceae bacterium]MCV0405848.1 TIGR02186 family protein [Rhizobiaceae bacterium]